MYHLRVWSLYLLRGMRMEWDEIGVLKTTKLDDLMWLGGLDIFSSTWAKKLTRAVLVRPKRGRGNLARRERLHSATISGDSFGLWSRLHSEHLYLENNLHGSKCFAWMIQWGALEISANQSKSYFKFNKVH